MSLTKNLVSFEFKVIWRFRTLHNIEVLGVNTARTTNGYALGFS